MDAIKDAVVRVGRRVQALGQLRATYVPATVAPRQLDGPKGPQKTIAGVNSTVENRSITAFSPLASGYQKKVFQEFLEPLGMPALKINNEGSTYNGKSAVQNWRIKRSVDTLPIHNYTDNRVLLDGVLDLLVELTPSDLLEEQNLHRHLHESAPKDTPKFWYQEIPPLSKHMTPEQFEDYIHMLTHSKIYYRNSSSLNGVVNDILLYTHKLDNDEFKHLRSTATFNCLIKYYGYDKNQSSFARSLLIVMQKDGHAMNIGTINQLLKMLNINSNIRSNSNNLKLNLKYLRLCRKLGLKINLHTWTTVYDSIHNLYLKETFLNRVLLVNLPIPKSLVYKIVDDYIIFCKSPGELKNFIEKELRFKTWNYDSILNNKVLSFDIGSSGATSVRQIDNLISKYRLDDYSLKYIMEGIMKTQMKPELKLTTMLKWYSGNSTSLRNTPIIYKYLVRQMAELDCSIDTLNFIFRGLMYDAGERLDLPQLTIEYAGGATSESQKIFQRIVGEKFTWMKVLFSQYGHTIEALDQNGIQKWHQYLKTLKVAQDCTDIEILSDVKCGTTRRFERDLRANRFKTMQMVTKNRLQTYSHTNLQNIVGRGLFDIDEAR